MRQKLLRNRNGHPSFGMWRNMLHWPKNFIPLLFCLVATNNVHAQTIVPAVNLENSVSQAYMHTYLNSATIDYMGNCIICDPPGQLSALVISDDPGGSPENGYLVMNDWINSPYIIPFTGITADVVIGNGGSYNAATADYLVAVVCAVPSATCANNDIMLYIYDFQNVGGFGGMTLAPGYPLTYTLSNGLGTASAYPHIDIMPEYTAQTGPGGFPNCNKIVVSFTDANQTLPACANNNQNSPNPAFGVNLIPLSLDDLSATPMPITNSPAPSSVTAVWGNTNAYYTVFNTPFNANEWPMYADVTVVEAGISPDYISYFTYVDNSNNLYVQGFDFTSNASLTLPANLLNNNSDLYPRIEGLRNYVYNDPATSTNANYMVVDNDLTGNFVNAYSYTSSVTNAVNISGWSGVLPDNYPVITGGVSGSGPNTTYTAGYYHTDANQQDLFLTQEMDWTTGSPTSNNYYATNLLPIVPEVSSQSVTLSSTCNNDDMFMNGYYASIYSAWSNNGTVYDKIAPSIVGWRHMASTGIHAINTGKDWKIGPNPATDKLEIYAPISSVTSGQKASYKLTDMMGREMLTGSITGTTQQVAVGNLAPGMYIIHIYQGETNVKTAKFVKQ